MTKPPIILVPGFWLGGWAGDEVVVLLRAEGHDVTALTLPGLESAHVDRASITLSHHVDARPRDRPRCHHSTRAVQAPRPGRLAYPPYQRWTPPRDGQIDANKLGEVGASCPSITTRRVVRRLGPNREQSPTHHDLPPCGSSAVPFASATENRTGSEYWCQRSVGFVPHSSRERPGDVTKRRERLEHRIRRSGTRFGHRRR